MSWLDWAALALNYYNARESRKDAKNPVITNRPLTPEEKRVQQLWFDEIGYKQGQREGFYDMLGQVGQGLVGEGGAVPSYKPTFRSAYYTGGAGRDPIQTMKLPAIDFSSFTGDTAFWRRPPGERDGFGSPGGGGGGGGTDVVGGPSPLRDTYGDAGGESLGGYAGLYWINSPKTWDDLSPEEQDNAKADLERFISGAKNIGEILLAFGTGDYKTLLQKFGKGARWVINKIRSKFGRGSAGSPSDVRPLVDVPNPSGTTPGNSYWGGAWNPSFGLGPPSGRVDVTEGLLPGWTINPDGSVTSPTGETYGP